jgi:magnesium chelatase accessory protein
VTATRAASYSALPNPADERLSWDRDGVNWPHRAASRFVVSSGISWHVQQAGQGPVLLLLHGTGAATHSWRHLWPLLVPHFTAIAIDLPGHGFTGEPRPGGYALPAMARATTGLLRDLGIDPALIVGHSAGAAIMARMSLDGGVQPRALIALNGALLPFGGVAGQLFSPLAKFLAGTSVAPRFFAWRATDPNTVTRLMRETGSRIDPAGMGLYRLLARNPRHVAAALSMMANWDLDSLARDLPKLAPPLAMLAANDDRMIPPDVAYRVRALVPGASVEYLRGAGHLAHEERAEAVADFILRLARPNGPGAAV